ncbi:PRC-barrel domain containing protein [Halorussus salilacus]|uniref:PRC-barrel domain containing protein n=1 Tax=Halorussus salilacus TaxID=2953750 RepID=UPI0020A16298|nr:PRC-barrel domain containing protein [Halorussus salilacus]USZ69174.1 PRC-barrel domain containing protein [Halorussus salilacus]
MAVELTEGETDKAVVDGDGTRVGTVSEVDHGTAHVTADDHVVAEMKTKLDAGSVGEDTDAVQNHHVAEVTDDEIRLTEDR